MVTSRPGLRKALKCLNWCFCKEWILPCSPLCLSHHITQCLANVRYSLNVYSIDVIFVGYVEAKINSIISEIRYKYYDTTSF